MAMAYKQTQIEAIRCVRDIQSIKIIGRNPSNVESFCAELDDAVSPGDMNDLDNADIICTATSSPDHYLIIIKSQSDCI